MVNLDSKSLGDILKLLNGLMIIILINLLVSDNFFRIDLTEEKRFSIGEPTKDMLRKLQDNVYVEVYLEGDLPSGFKRLQLAIRETLEEFRVYSGNKVQYSFIDPDQATSAQSREEFMMSIAEKGVQPTDIFLTENGKRVQKRVLPGAVITYGIREKGVSLLKGNKGASPEMQLNQSAEGVEYQLASTIRLLTKDRPEVIGFTTGHGELTGVDILGLKETLNEQYVVRDFQLEREKTTLLPDLMILAKPESKFSPEEKYYLDQYIMKGGKTIFLIDALKVESDTFSIAIPYDLDLEDQLFKYGVRINRDLIQDMISLSQPLVVGNMGDQPQIQRLPWPFFPLINTFTDHPIVRNLDAISTFYISTIDTVKAEGVVKTPLMFTSSHSRTFQAPVQIDFNELRKPIDPDSYTQSNLPVGYLLEGKFTSVFKNRPHPSGISNEEKEQFKEEGKSSIIVISDGDVARNKLNPQTGNPMPLGFDFFSGQTFANEDLLLNSIQYLLDDQGLIKARNKEIVLRPLDKVKVQEQRTKWQIINLTLPIFLLIMYGLISNFMRKRKYSSF